MLGAFGWRSCQARLGVVISCAFVCACGSSAGAPAAPTSPAGFTIVATPLPSNTPPVISSYTPRQRGVAGLTPITFEAVATDADNDPLVYTWTWDEHLPSGEVIPQSAIGPTFTHVFESRGGFLLLPVVVTVNDGRGGRTQAQTSVNLQKISGHWGLGRVLLNSFACYYNFGSPVLTVVQNGRQVTGEYDPKGGCVKHGPTKIESGTVDEAGNFSLRLKDGSPHGDIFLKGTLDGYTTASATATYQGDDGFDAILLGLLDPPDSASGR
jgi:PKD domain